MKRNKNKRGIMDILNDTQTKNIIELSYYYFRVFVCFIGVLASVLYILVLFI